MNQNEKPINWHITEYLDYYCRLSQAPGFAVLLKGQWGSGKTWFINNYRKEFDPNQQKCLYVSLYGITSFSEIEYEFFRQLHPVLGSKGAKLAGKIIKGLIKGTLKIDFDGDGKDDGTASIGIPDINLPDYLKNIDEKILIFDDLERCNIEISSLLGYINNFVEHQDFKVIIVANEDELLKKSDSYKVIKEKLIGKTFEIYPDISSALEEFVKKLDNSTLKDFLKNTELIKNLYQQANYDNLRTLKQIILDLSRIFEHLAEENYQKREIFQKLLEFLTIFSIEIRKGELPPATMNQLISENRNQVWNNVFHTNWNEENLNHKSKDEDKEKESIQKIFKTYPNINDSRVFPSLMWWQNFFHLGVVDTQELKESIANVFFADENAPNWVKLWHFTKLEDSEFENLLKTVELEFEARQYYDLDVVKHIVGTFLEFSEMKFSDNTKESILDDAKNYIKDLKKSNKIPVKLFQTNKGIFSKNEAYKGLGFRGKELQEFKIFLLYIDEIQEQVNIEAMPNLAGQLIETMKKNIWNFRQKITLNNDHSSDYYNIPILKYIKPNDFITQLLQMDYENQLRVFWALSERYKFDDINKKLVSEMNWLKEMRDLLVDKANHTQGKISKYKLEDFKNYLENEIIKILESSQTQNTETTLNEE